MNQEPEAGGAVKPASSDTPDAKQTARIAAQAAKLARKPVADEWDKAGDTSGVNVDPGDRRVAIGVDVGGSGIKAAAVDLDTGELISPRHRVPTPQPSAPAAVIASIARMMKKITTEVTVSPRSPSASGFPAVVIDGVTKSAANVDPGWVDFDADTAMERVLAACPPGKRRRCGGRCRDALWRGSRPARHGVPDHARDGDRWRPVLQRHARAQPGAGPHGDPRPRCRTPLRRRRADQARHQLEGLGQPTSTSTCSPSRGCSRHACSSSGAACPSAPSSSSRA